MNNHHDHACCAPPAASRSTSYRRVLGAALAINAAMFVVELASGIDANSVALLADAADFFGDAANYAISLIVLGMATTWRARAALFKGVTMGVYGVLVLGKTAYNLLAGGVPEALTMGSVGSLALAANVAVALMLYAWRDGDANMRSVWLCTRNDAIGNVAVVVAALGVFGTGSAWPDLVVALVMALLGVSAARSVILQARGELGHADRVSARMRAQVGADRSAR